MGRLVVVAALAALSLSGAAPAAAAPKGRTLYVRAGAAAPGQGSLARPFASLQAVEAASRPGDHVVVLPASAPLDARAPRLTNTSGGTPLRRCAAAPLRPRTAGRLRA